MNDPIVPVSAIQRRARIDADAGIPITDCPFPPMSRAAKTWLEEHARHTARRRDTNTKQENEK